MGICFITELLFDLYNLSSLEGNTVKKKAANICKQQIVGKSGEKCYFRNQLTNNKADKFASLSHVTCVKQERCKQ